jgi:hypothetical protein
MVNSGPAPGRPQILVWPPHDSIKCAKVRVAPAKWIIKRPRAGISLCANSKAAFRALVGGKNFLSLSAKKNKSYFLAQKAYCRKVVRAPAPTAFTVVAPLWSLKVLWNSKSHSAFRVFWRGPAKQFNLCALPAVAKVILLLLFLQQQLHIAQVK